MSSDAGPMWGQLILLLVLILVNAYFAAAEIAIVSVNKNRVRSLAQDGNKKAETLVKLIEDPNKFLSAIQVVITLAGFFSSAQAAFSFSGPVGAKLESWGIPYGGEMALIVITLILSFLMLVLGELFPKRLAMLHADAIAMSVAKPIKAIATFFKPFVWLLSLFVTLFLKICRQRTDVVDGEYSEDDVVSMLEAGQESGELKAEGKKMITSIFAFDDMLAYEVMTPRTDVFCIDINAPTEEYIDEMMELRYSRIPVYEDDSDNIIGILYIHGTLQFLYIKQLLANSLKKILSGLTMLFVIVNLPIGEFTIAFALVIQVIIGIVIYAVMLLILKDPSFFMILDFIRQKLNKGKVDNV